MKKTLNKFIIGVTLITICSTFTSAQILGKRDSLPIKKKNAMSKVYQVKHQGNHQYSFSTKRAQRIDVPPNEKRLKFLGGALTLFTGLNTGSSTDGQWMMLGELETTDRSSVWKMPLYFKGTFLKDRERVKNDDGSYSVEVAKALSIDWDQESYGFIFEGVDTIGYFTLITNVHSNAADSEWLTKLTQEGSKAVRKAKVFQPSAAPEFKISLAFRGRSFTILSQSAFYRSLILIDEKPTAVFQSDPDYVALGKANRINPYLLFGEGLSDADKVDLIRLSILTVLIRNIVSQDVHQM